MSAPPEDNNEGVNPVVAAAHAVKDAVKKHTARPTAEQRPSVRLIGQQRQQQPQPQQEQSLPQHATAGATASPGRSGGGWRSWFGRSDPNEQEGNRQPVLVPKHVAEKMAPEIEAAKRNGNTEDPQALAEHFAKKAEVYDDGNGNNGVHSNRKTGGWRSWFGSDDDYTNDYSTIHGDGEYDTEMVDLLDVIDPEVSTLSTLTNVQNSLFVPSLGKAVNRRPAYHFSTEPEDLDRLHRLKSKLKDHALDLKERAKRNLREILGRPPIIRTPSISSQITEHHWAVLQHGETLDGWSKEDKEILDDMVRHSLHSRRAKFARSMKGFSQFVRRPLGLFVTVYATLITLFGLAWVLFLIGWISLGSKQDYVINIVDNVLVALFAIIGDGLAPFRAVDTYHMIYIAHYYRKTWKLRRKLGLPDLADHNDLPEHREGSIAGTDADVESIGGLQRTDTNGTQGTHGEYSVLTEKEQATLEYHERKFSKSHTFYKPHETATHYAFPLKLLVAIVVLLDMHSALQITLGACTWGINYKKRPFALTTVVLCCSITCNIMGGVLISRGDKRTRKKDVLELMMRRELTSEAIEKMQKNKMKEAEETGIIDRDMRKRAEDEMEREENEKIKSEWKRVPFLPKKLLGKGWDSREPALPKRHRHRRKAVEEDAAIAHANPSKAEGDAIASAGPSTAPKTGLAARLGLGTKPEEVERVDHAPAMPQRPAQPEEGKRDKIMKFIRRADMDMS